jgi:hypothetical protein
MSNRYLRVGRLYQKMQWAGLVNQKGIGSEEFGCALREPCWSLSGSSVQFPDAELNSLQRRQPWATSGCSTRGIRLCVKGTLLEPVFAQSCTTGGLTCSTGPLFFFLAFFLTFCGCKGAKGASCFEALAFRRRVLRPGL